MDDAMTTMTTMMAGELAIGMGMRIVAGHPQLRSDRCYTIVAHLPDESGYLVDATPPRATKFPEQRTVRVLLDEIDSFDLVSEIHIQGRIWMTHNFTHALRSEGFDPKDARIVREWPQPRQFPIVDPFEALPLLAASLSSPGHQFDTVSGCAAG